MRKQNVVRQEQKLSNTICFVFFFCLATVLASPAQTFKSLVTFDGTNGIQPGYGSLVQDTAGGFYGTTLSGGDNTDYCSDGEGYGCGTIFKVTPAGEFTALYNFCSQTNCTDGNSPFGGLVRGANGNFYGTTSGGGFGGTVFEITPQGALTTLYSFCSQANCADGEEPLAGLVLARNGSFYGTTSYGGANNAGTIFEITPAGKLSTLHNFCSQANCTDGNTVFSPLVQGKNGKLYGTTTSGGAQGAGTVFQITLAGKFTTLHNFGFEDGAYPYGALLETSAGSFVGTTLSGGTRNDGAIFQITSAGKFTTLYDFCVTTYCRDGANPTAGLIRGANGDFYGTTNSGGTNYRGTVFKFSAGKVKILYSFCSKESCADGESPLAGVVQTADGTLYGTTEDGGDLSCPPIGYGCGAVFSLVP
jgi:uncharacterized repeat protein (TIGR03803 family)